MRQHIKYLIIGLVAIMLVGCKLTSVSVGGNASARDPYVAPANYSNTGNGIPVYREDECVGAVVNGECHGGIVPKSAWQTKCYGDMINGQCTGPMF